MKIIKTNRLMYRILITPHAKKYRAELLERRYLWFWKCIAFEVGTYSFVKGVATKWALSVDISPLDVEEKI